MTDIPDKYKFKTYMDRPLTYNCRCVVKPITKEDYKMKVLGNFIFKDSSRPLNECLVYQYLIDERHAHNIGKPFQTVVLSHNKEQAKTVILVSVEPYNQYEIEKYLWRRGAHPKVAVLGAYSIDDDEETIDLYNEECAAIFNEFKEKRGLILENKYKWEDTSMLNYNQTNKEGKEMCNIKVERKITVNGQFIDDLTFVEVLEYVIKIRKSLEPEYQSVVIEQKKKDIVDLLTAAIEKAESF